MLDLNNEGNLWKCLFATDWFVLELLFERFYCSPFPAINTQLFFQSLSSHTVCSCLEIISTTNNFCNLWRSKVQQVSVDEFCRWVNMISQKLNFSPPNTLLECTEFPSMLPTNTYVDWDLWLSWNNHLVTSFSLKMIVGDFYKYQNKTSDTDRYKV